MKLKEVMMTDHSIYFSVYWTEKSKKRHTYKVLLNRAKRRYSYFAMSDVISIINNVRDSLDMKELKERMRFNHLRMSFSTTPFDVLADVLKKDIKHKEIHS